MLIKHHVGLNITSVLEKRRDEKKDGEEKGGRKGREVEELKNRQWR
jgi:hypothetical protein